MPGITRGTGGFSFGTGKVGDLAGFASATVLGLIALGIAADSMTRLFQPVDVAFVEATWITALGLAVSVASAALLSGHHGHGHAHGHHHNRQHAHEHGHTHGSGDNNLRAAYVHVLADTPVMGVVGGLVIGRWSWVLMRDTAAVLLDSTDAAIADEIRDVVEGPGDARIVDLHVWRTGPEAHDAIVSVAGATGLDAEVIRARLEPVQLAHLTVEFKPIRAV